MTNIQPLMQMLWSVFPIAHIYTDHPVEAVVDSIDIIYDFVVPEHKLLIDIEDKHIGEFEIETRRHTATNRGFRYIAIPRDVNTARNRIISAINTIYVSDNSRHAILEPKYAGDAGWDLVTAADTVCTPHTHPGTNVPTDLAIALPNHLWAMIQARSSTSLKNILVLPGVIDAGYRNSLQVMVHNLNDYAITIKKGERIAQLILFSRVLNVTIDPIDSELPPSERGQSGFGSSGR